MIKFFAKKYVIGIVNDLLVEHKENVDKMKDTLKVWISRIDKVLFALRSMLTKLDDNQITDEEVEKTIEEITTTIKEW